jgi:large subunit ribosomal protein L10
MAISRKKKEETVDRAKQQLEGAYLVAGIKYAGLTVKQFQQLRKSLPQDTTLMVAKNKLIGKKISFTVFLDCIVFGHHL